MRVMEYPLELGRSLIVSPHPDDAVFSCWSHLVAQDGSSVIVIFDGIPNTDDLTPYDRFTGATSSKNRAHIRVKEDQEALARLGARRRSFSLLDRQYDESLAFRGELGRLLVDEFQTSESRVFIPASIGGHEDHLLARDSSLEALHPLSHEVFLYADLPYAAYYGWAPSITGGQESPYLNIGEYYSRSLETISQWKVGEALVVRLDQMEQARKEESMRMYATQFPAMEGGPSRWLTHPDRIAYEVVWRLSRL